jgi:hypothetical protein
MQRNQIIWCGTFSSLTRVRCRVAANRATATATTQPTPPSLINKPAILRYPLIVVTLQSMGPTCSKTLAPYKEPEPRPLDPMGETRIRLSKEVYPALCDEDFSWMKSTKGALVITGEDEKDLESPNAKVRRFKTEEALQKFIEGRQLVNTTVIRWYNIYAVPQYDNLFTGCHNVDDTTGCVRVVYPITFTRRRRRKWVFINLVGFLR